VRHYFLSNLRVLGSAFHVKGAETFTKKWRCMPLILRGHVLFFPHYPTCCFPPSQDSGQMDSPKARSLPEWKSSRRCSRAASIRRTSVTSERKEWCWHERRAAPMCMPTS